ncbi:hypothetical protein [Elizabethkingia ursingii]|jgi:hypothetical protein|uniref:Uncharacterized protein n=1 Tax=Elizabethkingia ursingii TaxID=1756150 RepID=A0AAJ3NAW2_9FLAO|nr:hypothetical protein [Elizabethkingia ursingii]MDR2229218.1 hypothetical protein [Flavobacteriaceae bacterium]AQX08234.1 hypothetical protein BBD34_06050 [Elizabethkingia ursingii]OPB73410.1 hypothetical protein BAY32_10170 [Elizabethkingia ursingii]OPB86928.1 hypothetical protein BB021_10460 [Elizabethkingia ursingii]OPC00363.1 hypothetical protein BAS09_16905 [Elizabethkingia ursingii]
MKKIFISYADENMAYSLKRIGKQALKLGIFDEVLLYTPDKLPGYIKSSPLMQYKRGGGYWIWKSAIMWETLQMYDEGTFVVYADAGCSLYGSDDWEYYFNQLKEYNTICFQYKDVMPEWEKFGQISTKIKYWSKQAVLNYFHEILKDDHYEDKYNKILAGLIFCKGKNNQFIRNWLDITIQYPELIIDPTDEELKAENPELAFHKHDQAIITPLAHQYEDVLVLQEKLETSKHAAILASRIRAKDYKQYLKLMLKLQIRHLLGDDFYNKIKGKIN